MKILPTESIRQLDAYTMEHEPISSIDLMERAATALTEALAKRWQPDTPFVLFAGSGNNGGDALAVARQLAGRGYRTETYLFNPKGHLSPDCQTNKERLLELPQAVLHEITSQFIPPHLTSLHVVVDGLFGSGLNRPLGGGFASVVRFINASPAYVVAIDVPSGLMGEDNSHNIPANIIRADLTLTLQLPKLSFLFAENEPYVGKWQRLDIGLSEEGMDGISSDYYLTGSDDIAYLMKPRGKFTHKGSYGRALLIAGSLGMAGASVLSAKACLRSGVGLLTVYVPRCNNGIVQTAVPEAMTQLGGHDTCFDEPVGAEGFQAIGIGPGLGRSLETTGAILAQLSDSNVPMVIDADALNALAEDLEVLYHLPEGCILTPHPKELERLVGVCTNSYERLLRARQLARDAQVTVVLKGAYTAVITSDGICRFNTTGNPGMATGGSGDVLTGVLLALLAQGYDADQAALLGVFVHGLAGDMARKKLGMTGMTAGDLVQHLPLVWKMLEEV